MHWLTKTHERAERDSSFPSLGILAATLILVCLVLGLDVIIQRALVCKLYKDNRWLLEEVRVEQERVEVLIEAVKYLSADSLTGEYPVLVPVPDPGFQRWQGGQVEFSIDPANLREVPSQKNETSHGLNRQIDGSDGDGERTGEK